MGVYILLHCGWNVHLVLLIMYDAVLASLTEKPSGIVSSQAFASTAAIDIWYIIELGLVLLVCFVYLVSEALLNCISLIRDLAMFSVSAILLRFETLDRVHLCHMFSYILC